MSNKVSQFLKCFTRLPISLLLAATMSAVVPIATAQGRESNIIRVQEPRDVNDKYGMQMLELALSRIDHNYEIIGVPGDFTQARNIELVASGDLDIMRAATTRELESELRPIRIPLYKGLLGNRVLIIRQGDQARFDGVRTFEDLKRFSFGQGTTWADTVILEHHNLDVVKTYKYHNLFFMLEGGRFDAFPRGAHEPWAEVRDRPELKLEVERNILLIYRMPLYFFVNKDRTRLAADIELGLNRAIADGGFDEVFNADETVQSVAKRANLGSRIVFEVTNPNLPSATPLDRAELWLDPKSL